MGCIVKGLFYTIMAPVLSTQHMREPLIPTLSVFSQKSTGVHYQKARSFSTTFFGIISKVFFTYEKCSDGGKVIITCGSAEIDFS
jgi:hypothetical protein